MRSSAELSPCLSRGLAGLVAALALCAIPSSAQAAAGELELWGGLGTDGAARVAVEGRLLYDLDDFWAVGALLEQRQGWPILHGQTSAFAVGRLIIDALTWVPAITAAAGAQAQWPGGALRAVGRVEGSLAWRPTRAWAAVARLGLQRSFETEADTWILLTVGVGWMRGGATDLDY